MTVGPCEFLQARRTAASPRTARWAGAERGTAPTLRAHRRAGGSVEYGILGSLQVRDVQDREAEIKGTRRRGLLLRLLVDANTFVSVGRLSEDLWEGAPPPGAAQTIQSHVSNLRKALGRDRVENQSKVGYRLVVADDEEIDATVFEDEAARG